MASDPLGDAIRDSVPPVDPAARARFGYALERERFWTDAEGVARRWTRIAAAVAIALGLGVAWNARAGAVREERRATEDYVYTGGGVPSAEAAAELALAGRWRQE